MKTATHLLKTSQKYCACHTKPFSTRYKTRLNVTKCHACHAKRSNGSFETSKKHPFCRTYHRHGHTALTQTVADGCRRLRTVANVKETSSEHTLSPQDPQSETGTLATHSGKSLYTEELLHTDGFTQIFTTKPLHRGTFTQRNLYAQTRLHTVAFTHRSFCTEKSLPIFHHV